MKSNWFIDKSQRMVGVIVLLGGFFSEGSSELHFPFNWWQSLLILFLVIYLIWWAISNNILEDNSYSLGHEELHQEESVSHAEETSSIIPEKEPESVIPDDLTKVEGIGPKISSVFQDAGIRTFKQLANTTAERLREILDQAQIRLGDPTTWPEQAKLADEKDWAALEALQDSLKGGRRES